MGLNHDERRIEQLLKDHHAVDVSTPGNHRKYRFPDGRTFVMSATPSDWQAKKNALRDLIRFLGIIRPPKREGERRPRWKKLNRKHQELNIRIQVGECRRTMAEQLAAIYKGEKHGA